MASFTLGSRSAKRHGTRTAGLSAPRNIVFKLAALFASMPRRRLVVQSLSPCGFSSSSSSLSQAGVFFFGRVCSESVSFQSPPGCRGILGSSIRWCSRTFHQHRPDWGGAPTPHGASLLLIRAALSQMDVPTPRPTSWRSSLSRYARRRELHSVPRSLPPRQCPRWRSSPPRSGPGALICGTLKISYDLLLLMQFRHLKRRKNANANHLSCTPSARPQLGTTPKEPEAASDLLSSPWSQCRLLASAL